MLGLITKGTKDGEDKKGGAETEAGRCFEYVLVWMQSRPFV